jgi:hypothetical protein
MKGTASTGAPKTLLGGWMGGWVGKRGLRIAYSNQKDYYIDCRYECLDSKRVEMILRVLKLIW